MKPKPLEEKIADLRTRWIDAISAELAAIDVVLAAFNSNARDVDPRYHEYKDKLRAELNKVKDRDGSKVIWIDEIQKLKEIERLGVKL